MKLVLIAILAVAGCAKKQPPAKAATPAAAPADDKKANEATPMAAPAPGAGKGEGDPCEGGEATPKH